MKKNAFITISILLIGQSLCAISDKEIINKIQTPFTRYEQNTSDSNLSGEWNKVFNEAKTFVIDKSKNFLGSRDVNIINAMNHLENANNSITQLTQKGQAASTVELTKIRNNITSATNMVSKSSRTEAKNVIMTLALALTRITQAAANNKSQIAPARPNAIKLPATSPTQGEMGECQMCYEDRKVFQYPCGNQHPEDVRVCKGCLSDYLKLGNKSCPYCREPLDLRMCNYILKNE